MPGVIQRGRDPVEERQRVLPLGPHETAVDRDRCAVGQTDGVEASPLTHELDDPLSTHVDAGGGELRLLVRGHDVRPVREHGEALGPASDESRAVGDVGRLTDQGEAAALQLPRIAGGAAEQAHAVVPAQVRDIGERLTQPGGQQHRPGRDGGLGIPAADVRREHASIAVRSRPLSVRLPEGGDARPRSHLHVRIGRELFSGEAPQFVRRDAVAGQEPVRSQRRRIARTIGVDHQHACERAAEVEGGGETGRSAAHDEHVVVGTLVHVRHR